MLFINVQINTQQTENFMIDRLDADILNLVHFVMFLDVIALKTTIAAIIRLKVMYRLVSKSIFVQ